MSRYADSFSGFICQYTEAMLCAIDKMARNNISMLSDVLSSLNSKSAAGGKCDKIQKAYAKFALLVANDREYSATFLSCDAMGQTYLGIAGVPEQRRVFEKTLLDRPALPYGVKIQVQQGKYYGKYRPTIKGCVNGSTRNCKNDFFVFCVINNSTLYAYQVDNNTEPDKWLICQIHLKQSGACDYPKYYAKTHCEFVIRILLKYLENKIKRTELYKAELYNSLS